MPALHSTLSVRLQSSNTIKHTIGYRDHIRQNSNGNAGKIRFYDRKHFRYRHFGRNASGNAHSSGYYGNAHGFGYHSKTKCR